MIELRTVKGIKNAPDAAEIRTEVFIKEQGFTDEFDEKDESAVFVLLYDGGRAIATGRILRLSGKTFKLGRIAVRKDCRKSGIGRRLIGALEDTAEKMGAEEILISAQTQAEGFYKKCGYASYGEIYDEEGCPHIAMRKRCDR